MQKEGEFEIIKVNPKYEALIDRLTPSEYASLKEDIKLNGQAVKIIVNREDFILDGHHRYRACTELGIPVSYEVRPFKSELDDILFIWRVNNQRRHWTVFQRIKHALRFKPYFVETAKQNMSQAGKGSKYLETFHVDKILAKEARTSTATLYKGEQIIKLTEEAPAKRLEFAYDGRTYSELIRNVEAEKITASKAYTILKRDQEIVRVRAETKANAESLGLSDENNSNNNNNFKKPIFLNKDSTKIDELTEIKDDSVDLILTDPPYTKDNSLGCYEALAKLAIQKLKDGGSLVFIYGKYQTPQLYKIFAKYEDKLTWWWEFCIHHNGQNPRFYDRGIEVAWKPMIWFVKGNKRLTHYRYVRDFIESSVPDKTQHPWAQSQVEANFVIENLTVSKDSLVVDPFLGSGAFAIAAIKLGRYIIGIDIDKDTLENARYNILNETGISD